MSGDPRVVVTGLGVVAPNGVGVEAFREALREGRSGIRAVPALVEANCRCRVGGVPQGVEALAQATLDPADLLAMNSNLRFGTLAALEAWSDARLPAPDPDEPDWDTGAVLGTGIGGADTMGETVIPLVDARRPRRLGSTMVEQVMGSSVSARVAGLLGLGNQVTSNSSACATGTEALILALERLRSGRASRMLAGGSEGTSHYTWACFDAMRVLATAHNDAPARASRPMSASADGFVPAGGAGVLVLETLDSALERGARIHAEVLGGAVNCGGHRQGGSMTAPNRTSVRRCIAAALDDAQLSGDRIDLINGHLTGTFADPVEVASWAAVLERAPDAFPWLQATKSLIGHGLGAAGGMECVASVLQLVGDFVHPSANCTDLHPALVGYRSRVATHRVDDAQLEVVAKASFGFGDVNACIVFRRWPSPHWSDDG